MRLTLALLALAATAAAGGWSADKLALVPDLMPRQRRAAARALARGGDVGEALREAGAHPRAVELLEALPDGPLALQRYAHALVFEAPGLNPWQRRLFDRLVPGAGAAQLALAAQGGRLVRGTHDAKERARFRAQFERQVRAIGKRFWRITGYALTVSQRAAIHPLLPQPYQIPVNAIAHVCQTPGTTPSQAARVTALLAELESENAADTAELARRRRAGLPLDEVEDRLAGRLAEAIARGRALFTPEQLAWIDAIPPLTSPQDRARHPGEIVGSMALREEQRARLERLGTKLATRISGIRAGAQRRLAGMAEAGIGADSPQSMTMRMMQQNAAGATVQAMEETARAALAEVFDPDQVLAWVVTPE